MPMRNHSLLLNLQSRCLKFGTGSAADDNLYTKLLNCLHLALLPDLYDPQAVFVMVILQKGVSFGQKLEAFVNLVAFTSC